MMRKCFQPMLAVAGMLAFPAAAMSAENVVYTYDALGRLTKTVHSGTVNNGAQMSTTYDAADNRSTYKVTGSTSKVIVVPLNGFTVIPLSDD